MRAIFLDRDGVINENRDDHVTSPEQLGFIPGATEALANIDASKFVVVVVTNQASVGRGQMTGETLAAIHENVLDRVSGSGGRIDAIYACVHSPEADCYCRKPRPGLLHMAARDLSLDMDGSFLVGDAASDIQAAEAVGCQPILVMTGRGAQAHRDLIQRNFSAYWIADDLAMAVALINNYESKKPLAAQCGRSLPGRHGARPLLGPAEQ